MKRRFVLAAAALLLGAPPAAAEQERFFERLAGTWSGSGSVSVAGSEAQPMRCRASYSPGGSTHLHLDIACATDSFKLQISSDLDRDGDRLSGSWKEASHGVSGTVSGRLAGDRLETVVSGLGISARLSLALHGTHQTVTLASASQIAGNAAVTLRRR